MTKKSEHYYGHKPTFLFKTYAAQLIFRVLLLGWVIFVFCTAPEKLNFSEYFGLAHGFNTVDFVFLALLLDILSKFIPSAKISMGSLKQYKRFHIPTTAMLDGGRNGLADLVKNTIDQRLIAVKSVPQSLMKAFTEVRDSATGAVIETRDGVWNAVKQLLRSVDFLRMLPFSDEQLSSTEEVRSSIRANRWKEIWPVIVFWIVANAAVMVLLWWLGWFNEGVLLIWTMAYAVIDMVSVVLWCPLQILFMKNRCCTTCQIFNWDAIMTVTPLIPVWCMFSWILVGLSLIVLVRWELAFVRHPERFDERTNASLSCALCQDKLCYLREPLNAMLPDDVVITPVHSLSETNKKQSSHS